MIKENKRLVRAFLQQHYTDEKLAALLAHMRDGKFSFYSCCCLIGIPTADHALQGETAAASTSHYEKARNYLAGAHRAEAALQYLGTERTDLFITRACTYKYLIPMVRAEIKRREAVRQKESEPEPELQKVM